jgi:hypothetical protein
MRRLLSSVLAVSFVVAVAAGPYSSADEHTAVGLGNIVFGHDNTGVAMFDFNVTSEPDAAGQLLCAAEHHEGYPGVIIRVNEINRVRFGFRKVTFHGKGHLHDDPVLITVTAYDGSGTSKPDRFSIKAVPGVESDGGLHIAFEAEGEVAHGDIRVGAQN